MKPWRKTTQMLILTAVLAALGWIEPYTAGRADETPGQRWKSRTELQLTEDFYQALRAEGTKTYATGTSDEHLRQIAVSTRFMVETNLQLLRQQKRIIQLLEELKTQPAKP
jgi:hypothetical protein